MATIPTPRSRSQILGSMLNSLLSRLGLPGIKTGDPSLSILEAAAQSDFRNVQDIFNLLNATNLDTATGTALDRIGAAERVQRITASAATGSVSMADTSFSAIETRIYQGGNGITAGSTSLTVENSIPANGQLYIGRGTANAEGPIAYTTVTPTLNYFTVTLSSPTSNYHQIGESVVYAQGGDRFVPAGTVVGTPATSATGQVQYRTLKDATIYDGETSVGGIEVQCTTSGVSGNVGAGAINSFVSAPFVGATVTNTLPITNATSLEDDSAFRERIRMARKSRAKAIRDAVVSGLIGARSTEESGQIVSVGTSFRAGEPRTIYIDDGTGYQEKDEGVVRETLVSEALGGEQYFQLSNRPIAKAYLKSQSTAPFYVVGDSALTVRVGGVDSTHTFSETAFRDVANGSAYEVASSINGNPVLLFSARVVDSGTAVAIFAKSEGNEDLQLVSQDDALYDANSWLNLPDAHTRTLYLYKNGELLTEDGTLAVVQTRPSGLWTSLSSPANLIIEVDGVSQDVTINDSHFAEAGTPYIALSHTNSLQSWADVLNYRVAGITASVSGSSLSITSNRGRNDRASIAVVGGTIAGAMFDMPAESQGSASDYILDRNSGQIKLTQALSEGDTLVAGAVRTNAYVQSDVITSLVLASTAELWFVVDGDPAIRTTGFGVGTNLTWGTSGARTYLESASSTAFAEVQEGDWLIVTDSFASANNRGLFRISEVTTSPSRVYYHAGTPATGTVPLAEGGVFIVRSSNEPVKVEVVSGTYSAASLAAAISVPGATTEVSDGIVTVATNSIDGKIAVVGANLAAQSIGFDYREIKNSGVPHVGSVTSGHTHLGVPGVTLEVDTITDTSTFAPLSAGNDINGVILAGFTPPPSASPTVLNRHNQGSVRTISEYDGTDVTLRDPIAVEFLSTDQAPAYRGFDITAQDDLQFVLDGDSVSGRYSVPMYRQCEVVAAAGTNWTLREVGGTSFLTSFGSSFDWNDFAVKFKSRAKSHSGTKSMLWRWWMHGEAGLTSRLRYGYRESANQPIAVSSAFADDGSSIDVTVDLATGAARAGVPTAGKVGVAITQDPGAPLLYTYVGVVNLAVSNANRVVRVNYNGKTGGGSWAGGSISQGLATATVSADSSIGASGYLTLTAISGTFEANQPIQLGAGPDTLNPTTAPYGHTTLTLTLPATVTDHGIAVGETIYVSTFSGDFIPGARTVTAASATTLEYIDVTATAATTSNGTVSVNQAGENVLGGSVVTGDIVSLVNCSAVPDVFQKATKATVAGGGGSWSSAHPSGQAANTTLAWYGLTGLQFYPLDATANQVDNIATAVNALPSCPVSAAAPAGSATVDASTWDEGSSDVWYLFFDGFNWVSSHAPSGGNVAFTLRNAMEATFFDVDVGSEVFNEDVRLVPTTASAVARFLNNLATGGLANRGRAVALADGSVCMESSLDGSESSIQVRGGTANTASVLVAGEATGYGATPSVGWSAKTSQSLGLEGGQFAWIQNSTGHTKPVFTATTEIATIGSDGLVTLDSGGDKAWSKRVATNNNATFDIERRGQLVALTNSADLSNAVVGDYLWIRPESPLVSNEIAPSNAGLFRVVHTDAAAAYIENPAAVEQQVVGAILDIIEVQSIVPGDRVVFGSDDVGVTNRGERTVTSIGPTEWEFTLDTTELALTTVAPALVLGSGYGNYAVYSESPLKFVCIVRNAVDDGSEGLDVLFASMPSALVQSVNEAYGSAVVPFNKLQFPTSAKTGVDSYRRNTGLLAEANRILFGDETDANEYPGIASAGASYNISGPLIKNIKVALSVRPATGVYLSSVRRQVASSVAAVINKTPVGRAVAISEIVAAAQSVNGVVAVAVMSPSYNSGDDLIPVQPYEKPLVLDLENDVSVTFVGE